MKYRSLVFAFLSAALLVSCGKDNPTPTPQPEPGGGGGGGSQPALILSQDFTKGLGSFTKGGPNKDIWVFDSNNKKYGAQATGKDVKTPVESWLLSPEIDLTNYKTDVYLYFNHAFARVDAGEPSDYFSVAVSDNNGTTWTSRDVPKWLVSYSYYELAQSGNIALGAFKGKKIQIALIYKSKEVEVEGKKQLITPTWEITDLTISTERQTVLPDDAGDKYKSVPGWMELPQVKDASAWHAHTTILRFDRVRDYSFSYNEPCLVSDWVAYPLFEDFAKKRVDRNNSNWVKDPFLSKQSNVSSGGSYEFSSKGYDRGHQIPSADRAGGAMTNQHTFYCSNVTPQLHDFNGGVWEKLEEAVRGWTPTNSNEAERKDTLYVVTGCVADATCPTLKDHDGQAVAVPKAYYKALLRLKGGSYIGAGFYFKHENTTKEYKEFAISLKELEQKTGMTFFVNLPSDKAAAIKAEDPTTNKFWGLK